MNATTTMLLSSSRCVAVHPAVSTMHHQRLSSQPLARPANPFRQQPGAPCRLASPRRRLAVQAFALPPLVPVLARALTAGVLFYASMNWVYYRGTRKDFEKYEKMHGGEKDKRRQLVDKLTGNSLEKKGGNGKNGGKMQ